MPRVEEANEHLEYLKEVESPLPPRLRVRQLSSLSTGFRASAQTDKSSRWRLLMFAAAGALMLISLASLASTEMRARWRIRAFWGQAERDQEAGILDPFLFREALYRETDIELPVLTVEPTAEHTHSVLVLHGLGNFSPHREHLLNSWAPAHPNVKWYIPQSPPWPPNPYPGWYNPWLGNLTEASRTTWIQVAHNFYDESFADSKKLPLDKHFGDSQAYSSPNFWEDEEGIINSTRRLWHVLNTQIVGDGPGRVGWEKLIIFGFSQGGFMTLVLATTLPKQAAGYAVYSGYLPLRTHPHRMAFNPDSIIHWVQGQTDDLFGPALTEYSLKVLRDLNYTNIEFSWEANQGHAFLPFPEQTASMERLMRRVWGQASES